MNGVFNWLPCPDRGLQKEDKSMMTKYSVTEVSVVVTEGDMLISCKRSKQVDVIPAYRFSVKQKRGKGWKVFSFYKHKSQNKFQAGFLKSRLNCIYWIGSLQNFHSGCCANSNTRKRLWLPLMLRQGFSIPTCGSACTRSCATNSLYYKIQKGKHNVLCMQNWATFMFPPENCRQEGNSVCQVPQQEMDRYMGKIQR